MQRLNDIEDRKTRNLLACGAVGGPFFILLFLLQGTTRVDYAPFRHPVSALAIGEFGWIQTANFLITGLFMLAFAFGLRRTFRPIGALWGPLLVGLYAIGLLGAGCFVCDPLNGYPPGTPLIPLERSVHGRLHDLFGLPVFLGLPIACFVFGRLFFRLEKRGWAAYSALSGVLMFAAFVLAGMGFKQMPGFVDFAGVFQRLSITIGWTWLTLLAVHSLRTSRVVPRG